MSFLASHLQLLTWKGRPGLAFLGNPILAANPNSFLSQQKALGPHHPDDPWLGQVFTCWTEQQICRIISRHLSLGFPQNLYSLGEHPVIYWYLSRVYVNYAGLLHDNGTYLLGLHKLQLRGGRRKSKGGEGTARYVPGVDQYLVTIYGRLAWGMVQVGLANQLGLMDDRSFYSTLGIRCMSSE
jgi:hypothetical protein